MADPSRIEQLRRRVQLNPASITFAVLAEECRRAGRYDEAIATCRAGLRRHPSYLSPRVTLGRALLALGRAEEARAELAAVVRAAPDNIAALQALESIRTRRGSLPVPAPPARDPGRVSGSASTTDHLALPALEAFLAAIRRARRPATGSGPSGPHVL